MGTIYERLGSYDRAVDYYNSGLKIKQPYQKSAELYATLLNNMAYAQMKNGAPKGVREKMLRAYFIRDSIQSMPGIVSSKIKIGELDLLEHDTTSALRNFKEGFDLARKIHASAEMLQTLKLLTEHDKKNKDHFSKLYFKVNDSVQAVERATQNKFARIAYETDQIQEQNELLSRRNKIIITVAALLLLVAISGIAILRLRSKNKELLYAQQQQQANEKIYQLILKQQSETEAARNEERNRIAMELHDGIVNSIFTTRFNLMQLDTASTDRKDQLVQELEKTEQDVRKVSHDLQNSLFVENKGMVAMLSQLVAAQQNDSQTEFDVSVDKYIDWGTVSDAHKIHVYRIVQEAIQNVHKYAQAKRCLVMLLKTDQKITLRIWDNGVGFNPEKAKQGIGLRNIRTRAEALGGVLKISSEPNNGTTVAVIF
ncbi:sensor histidine kinase [Flavobacterium caeni]|nr:sensor histidine kinase [Flavobacterium caeni]